MKMKKAAALTLALMMTAGLAGCGSKPAEEAGKQEPSRAETGEEAGGQTQETAESEGGNIGDNLEISLATVIADNTPIVKGLNQVSETLNAEGFATSVYPAGQLGTLTDVMDRCIAGENTIMTCDPADLADLTISDMAIVQAPFLYDGWDDVDKLLDSEWWESICQASEDAGMKIIACNWSFGERHILTTEQVSSLSDLAGMKIRVPQNTNFVQTFTAFGAVPTPMALTDVYSALNQHTIDGLENPLTDIYQNKFQEVAKYCVADAHIRQICLIICGMDFWNTMTGEQQDAIVKAAVEAGTYERGLLDEAAAKTRQDLETEGVTFTNIDKGEFIAATEKYYEACSKELGWSEGLRDTIMDILDK